VADVYLSPRVSSREVERVLSHWRIYEKAPFEETEGLGSFLLEEKNQCQCNDLEGAMNIVFYLSADEVFVLIRGGDSSRGVLSSCYRV